MKWLLHCWHKARNVHLLQIVYCFVHSACWQPSWINCSPRRALMVTSLWCPMLMVARASVCQMASGMLVTQYVPCHTSVKLVLVICFISLNSDMIFYVLFVGVSSLYSGHIICPTSRHHPGWDYQTMQRKSCLPREVGFINLLWSFYVMFKMYTGIDTVKVLV